MDQHEEHIEITVEYTGKEPFHEVVDGNPTFHHIQTQAMAAFGLEASSAPRYVLQYEGTDLDGQRHVSSLGHRKLTLLLTLKEEPVKG